MTQDARAATTDEKALLRTPGDWTRAYLGIYIPNVIYTALLNGAPTSTDMVGEISFDGGSGTLANVKAEMTLWVGSTAGARDLGVCRIRKAPIAGTIYIGYTSEIDWADNCYLTIVDHAMLSRKPIIIDGGDILMDGETTYSDQHTVFNPVPVLTPHAVAWLTGASVDVLFGAGDSWVYGSSISGYAWTAPGSSASSGMATATPTITYNAAGYYRVECVVTAANGKTTTAVRFVMVFDTTHQPHSIDVSQAPSADYDTGGWSFAVKMHADADPATVIEGALAILFAEDWYGSTEQSIGQLENRENIICWGYIAGESIEWDAEISSVEFQVQGPHDWLKKIEVNPLALTMAVNTPDAWGVMPALTVDRALWHILHWRSNASALLNITLTGDARYAPKIESMDGSLWSQMAEIAFDKIFGRIGCDRYGRFFAVIDPQCVPEADRTWATVMTLTKKDWRDHVSIARSTQRKLAMLSASGWVVDLAGSVSVLYSLSMGHIHAQYGDSEIVDQLLAESQTQFNELAGLYLGWKNNELEFDFTLAQNNRMIDLWPNQFLDVSLATGDTPRGITYAGNLIPRSITLQPDPDTGSWDAEISCEAETFAELAVDGDIPASTGASSFDSSFPPLGDFPALPDMGLLVYLPPTEGNVNHPKKVIAWDASAYHYGVFYTENFDEDAPVWKTMNNGLSDTERAEIGNLYITPSGVIYMICEIQTNTFPLGYKTVKVCNGLGGTWRTLYEWTAYPVEGTEYDAAIFGLGINLTVDDEICIMGARNWSHAVDSIYGSLYLSIGNKDAVGAAVLQDDHISTDYGDVLYLNSMWYALANERYSVGGALQRPTLYVADASGSPLSLVTLAGLSSTYPLFARAPGSLDKFWVWNDSGVAGYCEVVALVPTAKTGLDIGAINGLSISPTGTHAMAHRQFTDVPYKTTDAGATWVPVSGTIPTGSDVWENCRDNNRWIFGGGIILRLTVDQGATYVEKSGNLGYICPLMDVNGIRFIE